MFKKHGNPIIKRKSRKKCIVCGCLKRDMVIVLRIFIDLKNLETRTTPEKNGIITGGILKKTEDLNIVL